MGVWVLRTSLLSTWLCWVNRVGSFLQNLTLVTRIFKARYFPSHTYLTAQLGHNPSYVWRIIMRARFIVRGGARWSIGSDSSISTLNDPWLSNVKCIHGSIVGAHFVQNVTINNLMNLYDKSWNEEVVRQVDIAAKIPNTPLIAQVQDDRLIWKVGKMVVILCVVLIGYVLMSSLILFISIVRVIGQEFGSLKFLLKLKI